MAHFEDFSKYNNFYGMESFDFCPKILLISLIGMRQGGFTSFMILGLNFDFEGSLTPIGMSYETKKNAHL